MKILQFLNNILETYPILYHEYVLGLYGVLIWEAEQYVAKSNYSLKDCGKGIFKSLALVGAIVVFDDELLAQYNSFAKLDYEYPPFWLYISGGFAIDIIRSHYTKVKE